MPLAIEPDIDLTPLNTLGIAAQADYLIHITDPAQIPEALAFAKSKHLSAIPWGDGSNVVVGQANLPLVLLKIEIAGRTLANPDTTHTDVRVGAGEPWDALVAWSVEQKLAGIEALSLIPGTVGAAPVQNIGAYGQEVSQTITAVEAYDRIAGRPVILSPTECEFSYRDSLFKQRGKLRYIVTAVTFRLEREAQPQPHYASLLEELRRRNIQHPTLADVRQAVTAIRRAKLPDPAVTPTAGSFFGNPIVPVEQFAKLQAKHPDLPHWPVDSSSVKLSAAWMIEQCGFRGQITDGVGTFERQALCLINPGHRPASVVLAFRDQIIATVRDRFGVTLAMEPELISAEPLG